MISEDSASKPIKVLRVYRSTYEHLDPLHRIVADVLVKNGRWIILEDETSQMIKMQSTTVHDATVKANGAQV